MKTKKRKAFISGGLGTKRPKLSERSEKVVPDLASFPSENPNPVMSVSSDCRIIYMNKAAARRLGTHGFHLGKKLDRDWQRRVRTIFHAGEQRQIDIWVGPFFYSFMVVPFKDSGQVNVYGIDITASKLAQEELEMKAKLLDNSTESIYLNDLKGRFIYVNEAAVKSHGYSPEEFKKKTLVSIDVPEFGKLVQPRIQNLKKVKESTFEVAHYRKDGSIIPLEVHASLLKIGGKEYVLSAARDITERKLSEEALRKADRFRMLGAFASGIAHEIRNPLVAIKGFFDMFKLRGIGQQEKEELAKVAKNETARIEGLLNNLLVYSRPSVKKFRKGYLINVVNRAAYLVQAEARRRNIKIVYDPRTICGKVRMDPDQMEEVFLNLFLNAFEAIDKNGKVFVRSSCDQMKKEVKIFVRDTGRGISKKDITKIFNPFYTTKKEGTGLGLSVSQRIIMNHGGTIWVDSRRGGGAIFTIILPLAG